MVVTANNGDRRGGEFRTIPKLRDIIGMHPCVDADGAYFNVVVYLYSMSGVCRCKHTYMHAYTRPHSHSVILPSRGTLSTRTLHFPMVLFVYQLRNWTVVLYVCIWQCNCFACSGSINTSGDNIIASRYYAVLIARNDL